MDSSLAGSTKHLYLKIWTDFNKFCVDHLSATDAVLQIPINTLSLYLASLFNRGYAPSTICTYNSALSYWHKLNNVQDPTSSFFILKLLQGAKRRRIRFDSRLPITGSILNRLVTALNQTCSNPFDQRLYKAMYLLAFYGFLRLGEITERSQGSLDSHCLKYSDVVVQQNHILISFQSYKHSIPGNIYYCFFKSEVQDLENYFAI